MKGFMFRKSIQLLPGVRLNISKSGLSLSLGPKGAHVTTGKRGTYLNLDLPGSGMYYRKKLDAKDSESSEEKSAEEALPNISGVQRLTTAPKEIDFVDGLRALHEGKDDDAYAHAQKTTHLADGAFLAGFLAFKRGEFAEAANYLKSALEQKDTLGEACKKYEIEMGVSLPITEEVEAYLQPNENGVLLALAETYQRLEQPELAIETLRQHNQNDHEDLVVRLSLAEILDERYPDAEQVQRQIVQLAEDVHNESPIHAALMFYRARALRKLGMLDGALDTLTKALARHKEYPNDLLLALRYERALIYEATGKEKEAHKEFQKVYAEAPSYEDVAAKLGL